MRVRDIVMWGGVDGGFKLQLLSLDVEAILMSCCKKCRQNFRKRPTHAQELVRQALISIFWNPSSAAVHFFQRKVDIGIFHHFFLAQNLIWPPFSS
jgi:hypothetical protein